MLALASAPKWKCCTSLLLISGTCTATVRLRHPHPFWRNAPPKGEYKTKITRQKETIKPPSFEAFVCPSLTLVTL
jgi:hypothetical protein